MINESAGAAVVRRCAELMKKKAVWHQLWQLVGEFIHQLKLDFTGKNPQGNMLNDQLFDSTGVDACTKSASALVGMLWQSGSRSFQGLPPKKVKNSADVKKYFEFFNETLRSAFDDPKAGFANALDEYMYDDVGLGTCALTCFDGEEAELSFEAWGVDEIALSLGRDGQLDELYREYCWELRRVVRTYGEEALSPRLREMVKNNQLDEKVSIIHCLDMRKELKAGNLSNLNMQIRSIHVEKDSKHVILESGFPEWPAAIGMFYRRRGEDYGRSPGMKALPDVLELNALKEARMLAIEMQLEPPMAVYSDSIIGNQKIDMSPRATNVLKASGKLKNGQPIFPLYDGGNIREADKAIEELKANINGHFMLDRLIDFNNNTEMTLGEVQYRAQLRGESLGSIFNRQIIVLQHTIERATALMFRKGKLGVIEGSIQHTMALEAGEEPVIIPEEIAKLIQTGKDFYEIKFNSPAARMMEAEEANGVRRAWEFASGIAGADPEVLDGLDADKSLEVIARNVGAPPEIMQAKEKIEAVRQARAQAMEQQAQLAEAQQAADVVETASNVKPAA